MVFAYANLAQAMAIISRQQLSRFVGALSSIGALAAALSFQEFPRAKRKDLVARLARYCKRTTKLYPPDTYHQDRPYELQDGLRKSAAIALSLGLPTEAMTISLRAHIIAPVLCQNSIHLERHKRAVDAAWTVGVRSKYSCGFPMVET